MKNFFTFLLILLLAGNVFAKKKEKKPAVDDKIYDLSLSDDDILVLPEDNAHIVKDGSGVHLFVKKRGDIQSIALLIDTNNYNDPDLSLMRAKEFNSVNGNELRYSYGSKSTFRMERLPNALISSTIETNFFGDCFHIYIPQKMYYGYLIQVQNECEFTDGMTVNIRTFALPHSDTGGKFFDNKLPLTVSDWQIEEEFAKIAESADGKVVHVIKPSELTEKLVEEIDELSVTEPIDLVFAIDATESMKDDFVELRKKWLSKFEKQMKKFKDAKIGLLFYKDYGDEFNQKNLPVKNLGFVKNASTFSKSVKNVSVKGGGDREEAVYEALYSCATGFSWRSEAKKKIILIGDAPPHAAPSETFSKTFDEISSIFGENQISVDCFLISDSKHNSDEMKTIKKSEAADELIKAAEIQDAK